MVLLKEGLAYTRNFNIGFCTGRINLFQMHSALDKAHTGQLFFNHHSLKTMNLYALILAVATLGGIGLTIWGWKTLQKSRKIQLWPQTNGKIESFNDTSEQNDLLPEIIFSYEVEGESYRRQFEFPEGTHPLPEFVKFYHGKYPEGSTVTVFYSPEQHEIATLEPSAQGDWMILVMGVALAIAGGLSLVSAYS
jgi:hypothetical protein